MLTPGPILFATDFSPHSEAAFRYASSLAAQTGAELFIVHVSEALPTADDPTPMHHAASSILGAEEAAIEKLDLIQPPDAGVRATRRMLHGDPAKEVLRFADEHQAGVIVVGSHGRTGLMKLLMGSVAEELVRESTRPVMVIRTPPDDRREA